jgi:predicted Zn-dependent peptidase
MNDPDYYALTVMNQVLGGGFTGRFFDRVRSREGLAYSVGGSYGMQYRRPGLFSVGCQTRSENTVRAIRALLEEIERIRREEITEEELRLAKESYLNSFIFNFDTRDEIIQRMTVYEYYGYPTDFLQRMKQGIDKVTQADVLRVAQTRLHPDQLQILVVGRPEDFEEPLSVFGPVNQIDITIPALEPRMPAPEAAAQSSET